jgi:hypothetical protein
MKITANKIEHKGEARIMLVFSYDKALIEEIRKIKGATWSQTRKAWHIPYSGEAFHQLITLCPGVECSGIDFDAFWGTPPLKRPRYTLILPPILKKDTHS